MDEPHELRTEDVDAASLSAVSFLRLVLVLDRNTPSLTSVFVLVGGPGQDEADC
ncbi:hypothetical protein AB5J72_49495 [Streptomyces sp. CG1]|uniref:hypothetical protein n=1 Tax=Streptomyces sp. CG1 TaxID=1287523 RepID=UPI0034E2C1DC